MVRSKRVGVAGGSPTWRRGVSAALADAEFATAEFELVTDWRPGRGGAVVVLHVEDAGELESMRAFRDEHPVVPVLVVAPALGVAEFAAAIRAGATSAVDEDISVPDLIDALDQTLKGRASAPPAIIHALAMRVPVGFGEPLPIDEEATHQLRALAKGSTVAQLAAESGFSEREMFRLLGELYARIGVENRTAAILWASRYGLLDED